MERSVRQPSRGLISVECGGSAAARANAKAADPHALCRAAGTEVPAPPAKAGSSSLRCYGPFGLPAGRAPCRNRSVASGAFWGVNGVGCPGDDRIMGANTCESVVHLRLWASLFAALMVNGLAQRRLLMPGADISLSIGEGRRQRCFRDGATVSPMGWETTLWKMRNTQAPTARFRP